MNKGLDKGLVRRILPFSSVDGPGNRTAIFLQGCNFNCLYCHNPETIALKDAEAVAKSVDEILEEIKKYSSFIEGVTISGGECTLQSDFLAELIKEIKKMGLTTFIDTNGSVDLSKKEELVSLMDMVMLDIKAFGNEEHKKLTGMGNDIVLKNAHYLGNLGKLYEVRTVIVPELLDNENNVNEISRLINEIDNNIRYKLIKYRQHGVRGELLKAPQPSDKYMEKFSEIAKANGVKNVTVR